MCLLSVLLLLVLQLEQGHATVTHALQTLAQSSISRPSGISLDAEALKGQVLDELLTSGSLEAFKLDAAKGLQVVQDHITTQQSDLLASVLTALQPTIQLNRYLQDWVLQEETNQSG